MAIKILMVSRWFWEERRRNGGKPGFLGELVEALAASGIDLTILSQADDAASDPEPRPGDGLEIHLFSREGRIPVLSPLDKILKPWSGYRKAATDAAVIRRFIRQRGPFDAVVAQCEKPDGLACALASLSGRFPPLLTQIHALPFKFGPEGVHFTGRSSLSFVFRRSARVVANSAQTAIWLQREYGVPKNKIGQCRIHLTAPFLNLAASGVQSSEQESRRILLLGALNRNKAPDVFLRAAILLAPDLPGWTFVLVGPETSDDSTFHATLQELTSHAQLAGRLEMLGRLEPSSVIEQIRRAKVVVCPSHLETFSRTTAEALALGRPVIVTETSGAAPWVQSTGAGSVIPANDPAALAHVIHAWIMKENVPNASAIVTAELTAAHAGEDLIREIKIALHPASADQPPN